MSSKKLYSLLQESFKSSNPAEDERKANEYIETHRFVRSKSGRYRQSTKVRGLLSDITFQEPAFMEAKRQQDLAKERMSLPQESVEIRL